MLNAFLQSSLLVFVLMTVVFTIAQIKRNNTLVDIGWGVGFILIALYTFFGFSQWLPRQMLVTAMIIAWGTRLSTYIYLRSRGKKEDERYAAMRERWGAYAYLKSFSEIFMLQGALMLIIATPIIYINTHHYSGLTLLDLLGFLLWQAGIIIESVADSQLAQFLAHRTDSNAVMQYGLWQFSRHPNYLGELCIWFGIWLLALSIPFGFLTIISPLTMIFIFLYFSIPITEKHLEDNPAYREYQQKTSALIPFLY